LSQPASYSGQFVILYAPLTYLAWLRLKAVIGNSRIPGYTQTARMAQRAMHQGSGTWQQKAP
jgi:hypothetical protein